jgi:hypothetical protein
VAWSRRDNLTPDGVFAQHVQADGRLDSRWPTDGLRLSSHAAFWSGPCVWGAPGGRTFVVWSDASGATDDIYCNVIVTAPNQAATTLASDGILVCGEPRAQTQPSLCGSADGVLVAWADDRNTIVFADEDIYALRLDGSGRASPGWPAGGIQVCGASGQQAEPAIVSDGAQGAIVSWFDIRSGDGDVYAQHVLASGTLDPRWTSDGEALTLAPNTQTDTRMIADGAGGMTAVWTDSRPVLGGADDDIYAQHVSGDGTLGGVILNTAETTAFAMDPNPASVEVEFTLPADGRVWEVGVYDLAGRRIWSERGLGDGAILRWNGTSTGGRAPPGVYLVRFGSGSSFIARRLTWLR